MTDLTDRLPFEGPPRRQSSEFTPSVVDNTLRTNIVKYLEDQVRDDALGEFSLANHIIARMKLFMQAGAAPDAAQDKDLKEERTILRTLLGARDARRLWSCEEADDENDSATNPSATFDSYWLSTMKLYIERADLPMCTSSMASSRPIRVYRLVHIFLNEGSQLKDYDFINAITRFMTTKKVSMFGDQAQLWIHTSPSARFDSCWLSIMKYYIERADLMLYTSLMASSRPVQVYRLLHIVIDEVSQLKNHDSINATARFMTIKKMSIFSDQCQLGLAPVHLPDLTPAGSQR